MNLPDHVESKQIDENQYILTNKITATNIKVGSNELNFLSYLYSTSVNQEVDAYFQLTDSQQLFLKKKFNDLGFLSKEVAVNIHKKKRTKNLARIPIVFFDPDRTLNKISFLTKQLITKKFLTIIILLNFFSFALFYFYQEEWLQQVSIDKLNVSSLIIIYIMIILTLVIHEFSHAITCHFYGGKVKEIGIMMFYFNLALYCDVSSSYTFKEKYKRVIVIISGLISQTVVGSVSIISYYLSTILGYNWNLLLYFSLLNIGIIVINLIPLVKLDGYWLFTQLVGISNLRDKSFKYIISIFIPKFKTLFLQFSSNEIRVFKWYGWASIAFTTFLWIYGIYYFHKLASYVNEWLSITVIFVSIALVILHLYKNFTSYCIQMSEELSVIQESYYKEKAES